ncbi:hypothetical protein VTI28DRAFT_2298 [Corynascus sepedonium]
MDLTSEVFASILSPVTAFLPPRTTNQISEPAIASTTATATGRLTPWQTSPLNPQSRLDSLDPLPRTSTPQCTCTSTTTTTATTTTTPPCRGMGTNRGTRTCTGTGTGTDTGRAGTSGTCTTSSNACTGIVAAACTYSWQIDAVDGRGRLFAATPRFALGRPPLRVAVCLPPIEAFPRALRAVVRPERALLCHGGRGTPGTSTGKVADLEVGRWLSRVLHAFAHTQDSNIGKGEEQGQWWWDLPFGSVIAVNFGGGGVAEGWRDQEEEQEEAETEHEVCLVPGAGYAVEQGMVGVERLKGMWAGEVAADAWEGLRVVEWERLQFTRQVHDVISLVVLNDDEKGGETVAAFKSVLQEQKYMYNELKMLLLLREHPNVVSRPFGVVTKKGRFGNRRGVCGILLEWFPLGSLRERLLSIDYDKAVLMAQRVRWARQVTEAMIHVNGHGKAGFYPDLKPDNVMLRENATTGLLDAVLIDMEQRGGWYSWSPPEVAYVEYLETLVDEPGLEEGSLREETLQLLRAYYSDPEWKPGAASRRYDNAIGGFSSPWQALLRQREAGEKGKDLLERAQVFMLGKLLWSIFEGQPLVRCGIDHEVLRDPDPDYELKSSGKVKSFPEFKRTPDALRRLIRACTAGAPEWADSQQRLPGVVLQGGKLYPARPDASSYTANDTLDAARAFWTREVELARKFVQEAIDSRSQSTTDVDKMAPHSAVSLLEQAQSRPLLSEVLRELDQIEDQLASNLLL